MKILFIHNTLTAYRTPFFNELSKLCDLTIMFYNLEDNIKIYNDKDRTKELDSSIKVYKHYDKKTLLRIMEEKFDCIVLPPLDDLKSMIIAKTVIRRKDTLIALWWGKWVYHKSPVFTIKWAKDLVHTSVLKMTSKYIDLFLSYGSKSKEYLTNVNIPEKKVFNFINSTEVNQKGSNLKLREKYNIMSDKKIILFMGRIVERKGVEILIKAFLKIDYESMHLLICGDGPNLNFLKEKYGSNEGITFTGQIIKEDISNFYIQSDVFVIPSYLFKNSVEPWGLTVNEAQQFNLPIIATTAVGSAYDLINSKNGIMIEQNNVEELVDALKYLIGGKITKDMVKKNKHENSPRKMALNCFDAINQFHKGN
ncbi:hypothetical protein IGI73_001070 [Enterococcus sp. DIV0755f]|uniref:glycosyltransferase family 4 protein n=1 Tax=Enterococcus TaxID=1350 RepID=UPI003D0FD504